MLESNELLLFHNENKQKEKSNEINAEKHFLGNANNDEESDTSSKWNVNSGTTTTAFTECSTEKSSKRRKSRSIKAASSNFSQSFIRKTSNKIIKRKNTRNSVKEYYHVIKKMNTRYDCEKITASFSRNNSKFENSRNNFEQNTNR